MLFSTNFQLNVWTVFKQLKIIEFFKQKQKKYTLELHNPETFDCLKTNIKKEFKVLMPKQKNQITVTNNRVDFIFLINFHLEKNSFLYFVTVDNKKRQFVGLSHCSTAILVQNMNPSKLWRNNAYCLCWIDTVSNIAKCKLVAKHLGRAQATAKGNNSAVFESVLKLFGITLNQ